MNGAMEMLTDIATFTWFASLKGTVLLALVLVAQRAFARHLSADGRYLLWLAVVISLVTPVGFGIAMPDLLPDRPIVEQSEAKSAATAEYDVIAQAGTQARLPGAATLPLLWLAGVLAVLAAMAASSRRFAALARKGTAAPEYLGAILRDCQRQAGCTSAICLRVSAELRAPVVSGLFRPVLLWPAGLEASLTPAQLRHVLMHEVTHVKRRDILGACIVAVLQALHWFNPAIWIAFSRLREDREMACDAATVRALGAADAHDYAHTLIQLGAMPLPTRSRLMTGLDMLDGHAQLRNRIHMLARQADPTMRHFLSPALLLAFSALAFSQPATSPRQSETPAVSLAAQAGLAQPAPAAATVTEAHIENAAPAPSATAATSETPAAPVHTVTHVATVVSIEQETKNEPEVMVMPVIAEPAREQSVAPIREPVFVARVEPAEALPEHPFEPGFAEQQDVAVATAAGGNEALVCQRVDTPGSRIRTRLCLTHEQWAAGRHVPRSPFRRNLSPTDFMEPLRLP